MNEQITTARLPLETRNKLLALAKIKRKAKGCIKRFRIVSDKYRNRRVVLTPTHCRCRHNP